MKKKNEKPWDELEKARTKFLEEFQGPWRKLGRKLLKNPCRNPLPDKFLLFPGEIFEKILLVFFLDESLEKFLKTSVEESLKKSLPESV